MFAASLAALFGTTVEEPTQKPAPTLCFGDALTHYASWPSPTCIVSDGPYGVGGYPGDPKTPDDLPAMYEPHVRAWTDASGPQTTLWFWNTEVGWATVHPLLKAHGWVYRGCNIWNKGMAHVAGNVNGQTMRKFPVVTEVCAHYIREPIFLTRDGTKMVLQDWMRAEWLRTGLPLSRANAACGVANAATRKYLTTDHVFYPPPPEVFAKLALYANEHGDPAGRPYFDIAPDEMRSAAKIESKWLKQQAKFNFEYGVTNVWEQPALRGGERLKDGMKVLHSNQKPMALLNRIIAAATDADDVVWDPFTGSGAVLLAAREIGRRGFGAEINPTFYDLAARRVGREGH